MAETAFDVISRCRATSVSSSVDSLGGSSAVPFVSRADCRIIDNHIRDITPGGKPGPAAGGTPPLGVDTVAKSNLSRTRTQPGRTGRTALYDCSVR